MSLVCGGWQLLCGLAVLGAEAALLARFVVLPGEDAVRSLEEPVFVQHGRSRLEIAFRGSFRLPSTLGVGAESGGILPSLGGSAGTSAGNRPFFGILAAS